MRRSRQPRQAGDAGLVLEIDSVSGPGHVPRSLTRMSVTMSSSSLPSCGDEPAFKRGGGVFGACSPVWCRSSDTDAKALVGALSVDPSVVADRPASSLTWAFARGAAFRRGPTSTAAARKPPGQGVRLGRVCRLLTDLLTTHRLPRRFGAGGSRSIGEAHEAPGAAGRSRSFRSRRAKRSMPPFVGRWKGEGRVVANRDTRASCSDAASRRTCPSSRRYRTERSR